MLILLIFSVHFIDFVEVFAIIKKGEIVGQLASLMCSIIDLVLMITNDSIGLDMFAKMISGVYRLFGCYLNQLYQWQVKVQTTKANPKCNQLKATKAKTRANLSQSTRTSRTMAKGQFGRINCLVHDTSGIL